MRVRVLRILLVLLLVGLFVGYFAFSTFLFRPFESDFEADVSALIPRDVDFFLAKGGLEDAFDGFPRLAVAPVLEGNEAWRTFLVSPEYAELDREYGIRAALDELEQGVAQIPLGMEPQEIFGGRDLALAGYFAGRDLAQADWAAYGRVNWAGKLAVALLSHPGWIGLEAQGLAAVADGDVVSLSGGQLARPLHLTRVQDVVVVGTSLALVQAARQLAVTGGEDSFLQSARYFDHVQNAPRAPERDELELYLDVRELLANLELSGPWPDTRSQVFTPALLGRLFQAPSCKEVIGVIGLDQGLNADLHGEFSSELIDATRTRLYRQRGFDREVLVQEAARFAPEDTSLFVYLHGPVGDLLRMVIDSLEPAMRDNLADAFRSTGRYGNLDDVVSELDGALRNRLVLIVRPNDYPPETTLDPRTGQQTYSGPPNDGSPVFAVALVTWVANFEAANGLRDAIGLNGNKFGLQGRSPGESGYFENKVEGFETREFWSQFVPGTGVIATLNTAEHCIVSNNYKMLVHVLKTYSQGGADARYPQLSGRADFQALVGSSLQSANAMVWVNPRSALETLRLQAQRWAEDHVSIDFRIVRAQQEARAVQQLFPGKSRRDLKEDEQRELDEAVDGLVEAVAAQKRAEEVPALVARKQRELDYFETISAALGMLKLDPKSFELSLRVVAPLEP